jgi:hypothetical protein
MNLFNKQYKTIMMLISVTLFVLLFNLIHYLVKNNYIMEAFNTNTIQESTSGPTSYTVNLPLTTTYSCRNFCGPNSRCAITGQQCTADLDCPGCQPYSPPLTKDSVCIPGENDAGKLTFGKTPQYSALTTDIGTQAALYSSNKFSPSPSASLGVNVWRTSFEQGQKLFDQRYKPQGLQYTPNYQNRYSVTGEFNDDGPLASNAYLS